MTMRLGGRYETFERIGVGGSAEVYRAHDDRLGRDVAVKMLDAAAARSADPLALRRFEVEATSAAMFVHPHAVTIYDAGTDQGKLYIVMELVTGGSLADRLQRAPLTSAEVRTLGVQIAGALEAAHASGIVHRDVKPSNVLLDGNGDAKLADFGIARRLGQIEESMTSTGMVMGTRSYVSPEQAQGQPLGPTTDIFSLGVTLYEAATGQRPPSALERDTSNLLDPRSAVPGFDAGLAQVIATASAMPADRRYATAADLAAALSDQSSATQTMPIHLRPDQSTLTTPMVAAASAAGRAGSGLSLEMADERRRRSIVTTVVAVVAVLAVVGIGVAFARAGDASSGTTTTAPAADGLPVVEDTIASDGVAPPLDPETSSGSVVATAVPETTATVVASTGPPPVTPAPPVELIPGFPVPVDIDEFLRFLEADPDLVGSKGSDLARELEKVLDRDDARSDGADKLRETVDGWTRDGELDPVIAATVVDLLDERVATRQEGGDDDD